MKTMNVSSVVFRPDPARPTAGAVELGHIAEIVNDDSWSVVFIYRGPELHDLLDSVDYLTRSIIENFESILGAEIDRILESAPRPGELLTRLSAESDLSVSIDAPVVHRVPKDQSPEQVLAAYAAKHRGEAPARRHRRRRGRSKPAAAVQVAEKRVTLTLEPVMEFA